MVFVERQQHFAVEAVFVRERIKPFFCFLLVFSVAAHADKAGDCPLIEERQHKLLYAGEAHPEKRAFAALCEDLILLEATLVP